MADPPRRPPARYRIGGLVIETTGAIPFCRELETDDPADVVLEHGIPWADAPPEVRPAGRSRHRCRHRVSADRWTAIDSHGGWVTCRRDGRALAGRHPDFDYRRRGVADADEYWTAVITTGIGAVCMAAFERPGHVTVHAAAASPAAEGPAILLTGPSGAGKSTIASALQMIGWHWIARDITRVRAPDAAGARWRVEAEWPIKHLVSPERPRWPTLIPAGPRFLAAGAPLGAVYALGGRRRTREVRIGPASPGMSARMRRAAKHYGMLHTEAPDCQLWLSENRHRWDDSGPPVYLVERPAHFKATDTAPFIAEHALRTLARPHLGDRPLPSVSVE